MTFLLNVLWFICGGWLAALAWFFSGVLLALTIVGLPWSFAAWRIAGFVLAPFGKRIVDRSEIYGPDIGTGPVGCAMNIVWFALGGWYIALAHLIIAACEAVTIIGIPFAFKDLQLAGLALAPVGKYIERID
jgi:uncharacterized membrane protein YccF (DUF307 family)